MSSSSVQGNAVCCVVNRTVHVTRKDSISSSVNIKVEW